MNESIADLIDFTPTTSPPHVIEDNTIQIKDNDDEKEEEEDIQESDIQTIKNTNEEDNSEPSKNEDNDVVSSKDIQFVLDTISKQAPHDKIQIKQIFCGICSSQTSTKIHHNINSKNSGEGKSYLLQLVSDLFPGSVTLKFNNMTDKALYHQNGVEAVKDEDTGKYEELKPILNELGE